MSVRDPIHQAAAAGLAMLLLVLAACEGGPAAPGPVPVDAEPLLAEATWLQEFRSCEPDVELLPGFPGVLLIVFAPTQTVEMEIQEGGVHARFHKQFQVHKDGRTCGYGRLEFEGGGDDIIIGGSGHGRVVWDEGGNLIVSLEVLAVVCSEREECETKEISVRVEQRSGEDTEWFIDIYSFNAETGVVFGDGSVR
jgi:hypothetical protein